MNVHDDQIGDDEVSGGLCLARQVPKSSKQVQVL
jgi:hypothetical protein